MDPRMRSGRKRPGESSAEPSPERSTRSTGTAREGNRRGKSAGSPVALRTDPDALPGTAGHAPADGEDAAARPPEPERAKPDRTGRTDGAKKHKKKRSSADTQRDAPLTIADELTVMGLAGAVEIGRGGFGVVYRCLQIALERVVAVKVLSSEIEAESRERFLREEHAMGRVSGHPNIVDILEVDVTPTGLPFIVMPYCTRGTLEQLVRDHGPLTWPDAVRVGVKLAGAIESAHRAGILHRDVKPANVLLSGYGEPQLTDFGIARIPGGFRTSSSLITGSPAFTAPEVLRGAEPTVRSDVYGLGATLFALLTGHAAFERQTGEKVVAQFLRITTQPVPDLRERDIPADVAAAIEQAMSTDPAHRPQSAFEFGEELRAIQRAHGQVPDDMALLDAADVPEPLADTGNGHSGARARSVTSRRSWPLTLRPAVSQHPVPVIASATMPPTAITKFRPPTPAREPIARPRLLDVLRAGGRRKLAVIHAPAGFGKSTVAAQWRVELTARGVDVAWIGVDDADDNEIWFLAHLVQAIRRVRPDLGEGLEQMLEERPDDAVAYAVSTLIDEIHAAARTVVVVVENWHRVSDEGAQRALAALLENGCHHLRFVVTSREQTGLPISSMRVDDELVEIGSRQLRLTRAETARILVERNGFDLTDAQVEQIHTVTDGWPAAIQLVGLALRGDTDPAQLIENLSASNHGIREYLAENVLDTLEPRMLDFLGAISVTERVSASLAAALSGDSEAEMMLAQAEQRELFLRRVEDDPDWYRMQPLFAEHLRARLDPAQSKALHRKASWWFAEHQQLRKSVDHALAATDMKLAMDLLESGGMDLIDGSRLATLLGTVSKLPVQQVASRSKLLMAVARANVNLQQSGAARNALGRLSNILSRGSATDTDVGRQRCEAAVLAAADDIARDHTEGVLDRIAGCLDRAEDLPAWTVSTAANLTSFVRLCDFDFAGAREIQTWAAEYHVRSKDPLGEVFGLCGQGAAASEQLDIDTADGFLESAWETAHTRSGPRSHAARVAAALLGEAHYRRGDLDAAERLLDESHQLVTRIGPVDFLIATFVVGARVKAARGDLFTAAARLDEGDAIAVARGLDRLTAHIRAERLRLGLITFSDSDTDDVAPVRHSHRARGTAGLVAEAQEIAVIRELLARPRTRGDDQAVRRSRALQARTTEQRRPRAELDATLLLAECLAAAGWVGEAAGLLLPAAAKCAELNWTRPLLDAGPGVVAILRVLRTDMRTAPAGAEGITLPGRFLARMLD